MSSFGSPAAYDDRLWTSASDQDLLGHMDAERLRLQNDDSLMHRVLCSEGPLLDYGCGPGFFGGGVMGMDVFAYDPSPVMRESVQRFLPRDHVFDCVDAIPRDTFDRVWCCLVLCIVDENAVSDIIITIREAMKEHGRALLTICNPKLFSYAETRLDRRYSEGLTSKKPCLLRKWKKESRPDEWGIQRGYGVKERHRPEGWYEEQFEKHSLSVEMKIVTPYYQFKRKVIPGDFLCFQCVKK